MQADPALFSPTSIQWARSSLPGAIPSGSSLFACGRGALCLIAHLNEMTTLQLTRVEVAFKQPEEPPPPMYAGFDEGIIAEEQAQIDEINARIASAADHGTRGREVVRNPTDPSTCGKVGSN